MVVKSWEIRKSLEYCVSFNFPFSSIYLRFSLSSETPGHISEPNSFTSVKMKQRKMTEINLTK